MFERYTESARKAVFFARYEASVFGSPYIETEHLLLGILREDTELRKRLFRSPNEIEAVREQIRKRSAVKNPAPVSVELPLSATSKRALHHAAEEAQRLKQSRIGPEHLLLGICMEESCLAAAILRERGLTAHRVRDEAARGTSESDAGPATERPQAIGGVRDLTAAAGRAELTPLIGRERELERIIQILSRRTKNNAVLIGEAGVGKTAIVEGLACRLADASAPLAVADRRLIALDASSLVSSKRPSRDMGRLEEALGGLAGPEAPILFIRGLFNLAISASAWSVVEAMHALEPYLAAGGLQCIATGSPAGLRETVEKAAMLARHFEVVEVVAVSEEAAIRIVSGLKEQFERFHDVTFAEGAIETAVRASGRFLPLRHLPDRAIDLIDEAAAGKTLRRRSGPPEVVEARKNIRRYARAIETAAHRCEFDKASQLSAEERQERENLARLLAQHNLSDAPAVVTPEDVLTAIAERAGIPVAAVTRALDQKATGEFERIAAELAAQVPVEAREWIPLLAAYLARCSPAEAEALRRAIAAVKAKAGGAGSASG